MRYSILLLVFFGCIAYAQNTPTVGVLPDNGPSLPATCVIGQIYFRTSVTPGLNQCNPANTWTALATGAGSGTVSANNGVTNAIATYAAAGGSTTVAPAANTACIPGATSGSVCITAPAIAGTTTNGMTFTNVLVGPIQTGPTYSVSGQTAQGFGDDATIWGPGAPTVWLGANLRGAVFFNGITIPTISSFGWSSSNINSNASIDTKLSRSAAGVVSFDSTSQGNGLGSSSNCRTTVNVTPVTVNANVTTDQNLMAFTLPANCLNTVGRTLRIFVSGVYSTAAASTAQMTLEVKICSISGCASGNVADVIDITSTALGSVTVANNAWNGTFYVTTQTASTAGAWEAHGVFGIDEGALTSAADSFFNDTNTATVTGTPSAIDTTAQNFLQVTFAFSAASASNSVTQRQLVIDSVN